MGSKLIFGCGYLGARVARLWLAAGEDVYAVTRSHARAEELSRQGVRPLVGDVTTPDELPEFPAAESVLWAVGFDRHSGKTIQQVYVDGLHNVVKRLPSSVSKFIYISSTGVYGQDDGQWVDEDSACQPIRSGGKACLAAEQLVWQHQQAIILRLAGIYGPGRIPRRAELQAGQPMAATGSGYLNLIHVDDAAAVVVKAAADAKPPALYVVSDGQPATRRQYYDELARLLHTSPPNFTSPSSDQSDRKRAGTNKRVRNRRMLDELQVRLQHPSFREGLAAIIEYEASRISEEAAG